MKKYNEFDIPDRSLLHSMRFDRRMKLADIARDFGVSISTVDKWLRLYSIPKGPPPPVAKGAYIPPAFPAGKCPAREVLDDLHNVQNMTLVQIGKQFGVSGERVRQWISSYGLPKKGTGGNNPVRNGRKPIKMRSCPACGKPFSSTKLNGRKYCSDKCYRDCFGRNKFPGKKTLSDLYSSHSIQAIADKYEVSAMTVYSWMVKNGISRRGRGSRCEVESRRKGNP